MTVRYTVQVREKGSKEPFRFIVYDGANVRLTDTLEPAVKRLARVQAQDAQRRLIRVARGNGRPIECRVGPIEPDAENEP